MSIHLAHHHFPIRPGRALDRAIKESQPPLSWRRPPTGNPAFSEKSIALVQSIHLDIHSRHAGKRLRRPGKDGVAETATTRMVSARRGPVRRLRCLLPCLTSTWCRLSQYLQAWPDPVALALPNLEASSVSSKPTKSCPRTENVALVCLSRRRATLPVVGFNSPAGARSPHKARSKPAANGALRPCGQRWSGSILVELESHLRDLSATNATVAWSRPVSSLARLSTCTSNRFFFPCVAPFVAGKELGAETQPPPSRFDPHD